MVVETIFAVLAVLVVVALVARAIAQHRHTQRLAPIGANGIDDAGFVEIGGIAQWIQIRGQDRTNPVLLVLHGGPGAALSAVSYALFASAERDFTIAHWDQRGAGRTFGRNGRHGSGEMSIARMTADGIAVAEHLCARLGKRTVVLCALSWGSVLALGMLKARPDLFAAYAGTGQIVDMPAGERFAYDAVLAQARRRLRRPAIAALEWIGPPPFGGGKARRIWQQWLLDFAPASERRAMREMPLLLLTAPRTPLRCVWDTVAGVIFSYAHLFDQLMAFQAAPLGTEFAVPMFFFQGSDDLQTPTPLVADYAARIRAPVKELVRLEGGGHMVIRTMGERFVAELTARLRPVVLGCGQTERFDAKDATVREGRKG
jgi:pimeloyl-ACP methyl ester carboxylesterase